mgnify:CR=1 FL=1
MPEEIKEEHKEEKKKKGALGKLKDAILPDADEQAAIMSTFVRLGVLVWSGGILTLNYVAIPGVPQQKIDPTFIASIFVGLSSTFGANITQKGEKGAAGNGKSIKAELQEILGDTQIVRVKNDITLTAEKPKIDKVTGKEINLQTGRLEQL